MKSSSSQPRSFLGMAVTTAARLPQHFRIARATLYSPPPSHTWNERALRTRPKPGSKRSITSPKDMQSHFVSDADLIFSAVSVMLLPSNRPDQRNGLPDLRFDSGVVLRIEQLLRHESDADSARHDAGLERSLELQRRGVHLTRRHAPNPLHGTKHAPHGVRSAHLRALVD